MNRMEIGTLIQATHSTAGFNLQFLHGYLRAVDVMLVVQTMQPENSRSTLLVGCLLATGLYAGNIGKDLSA